MKQVTDDSIRAKRLPLLVWQKTRAPRVAFIQDNTDISIMDALDGVFSTVLYYKGWTALLFDELLAATKDSFWFDLP